MLVQQYLGDHTAGVAINRHIARPWIAVPVAQLRSAGHQSTAKLHRTLGRVRYFVEVADIGCVEPDLRNVSERPARKSFDLRQQFLPPYLPGIHPPVCDEDVDQKRYV